MEKRRRLTYGLFLAISITVLSASGVIRATAADTPPTDGTSILLHLENTDRNAYHKVGNLQMRVVVALRAAALEEVRRIDADHRVTEIGNWPGAPVQVVAAGKQGVLYIRLEKDFLIIYNRRTTPVAMNRAPRDVIREATREILADAFLLGPDDTVVAGQAAPNAETKTRLFEDAKPIAGTIVAGWTDAGSTRWQLSSLAYALVKDRDVVIVFERTAARQSTSKYVYEGLLAAGVRLTKAETEQNAGRPVLARNLVFDEKADLGGFPSELLNGCMWPIADEQAAGLRDLCSAAVLCAEKRPVTNP